jgi:hypothetical protein
MELIREVIFHHGFGESSKLTSFNSQHRIFVCCWRLVVRYQATQQAITKTDFYVVNMPDTDSSSNLMGTHWSIALQE